MVERDRNMVRFVPGEATAIVGDRLVALVAGGADDPFVKKLNRLIVEQRESVDELVAAMVSHGINNLPGLAVVIWEQKGGRLFVRGDVVVDIDEGEESGGTFTRIDGARMVSWVEHPIDVCREARLAVNGSDVSFDGTLYSASFGVLPAVGVEVLWVNSTGATAVAADPVGIGGTGEDSDPIAPAAMDARVEPDARFDPSSEAAFNVDAGDTPDEGSDDEGPGDSRGSPQPPSPGEAGSGAHAGQTMIAADMLLDSPGDSPGASPGGSAPTEADAVVRRAMIAPAEELQMTGNYDDLFGSTQLRSVENAAVRPDSSATDVHAGSNGPSDSGSDRSAPAAERDEDFDSVHDGRTVSVEELRRLRGDHAGSPAPASSGTRGPGSSVLAVLCPSGHPNAPHEVRCRRCDALIESQDVVDVERPALGRLVFSTGIIIQLERTLLIGRSPKATGLLSDGRSPELVQLPSPGKDISRTHLEIRVEGWQVMAIDHNSANGTVVAMPGRPDQRLRPDEPFLLTPGATVRLADEVEFTMEANA